MRLSGIDSRLEHRSEDGCLEAGCVVYRFGSKRDRSCWLVWGYVTLRSAVVIFLLPAAPAVSPGIYCFCSYTTQRLIVIHKREQVVTSRSDAGYRARSRRARL